MNQVAYIVLALAAPAVLGLILSTSGPNYAALASAVAATLVALTAGAWYAQRWPVGRLMLGWLCGWLLLLTIISLIVAYLTEAIAIGTTDWGEKWPWE